MLNMFKNFLVPGDTAKSKTCKSLVLTKLAKNTWTQAISSFSSGQQCGENQSRARGQQGKGTQAMTRTNFQSYTAGFISPCLFSVGHWLLRKLIGSIILSGVIPPSPKDPNE